MGLCFSKNSASKNNVEKTKKKNNYVYGTRTTRDSTTCSSGSVAYIYGLAATGGGGCGGGGDGCGGGGGGCGGGGGGGGCGGDSGCGGGGGGCGGGC
ncbi:uncharacterized protein LOC125816213 [Solanum verrucosum]|uniref:uncharacterized protein LOC125816213 n=1 Tax=Solanum verrucosum TaxID=315347 RepID=UPI0020D11AAD|nr:uncharacterized protein LOC125816213 [Solanum verrucosum]